MIRAASLVALLATPALAIEEPTTDTPPDQNLVCEWIDSCEEDGNCHPTAQGTGLIVILTPDGALSGPAQDALTPIDRFATLDDAYPLPSIGPFSIRHFLVDMPWNGISRRFALYSQIMAPSTGAPGLLRYHQRFECWEATQ
jgi:hypothetical protein